MGGYSDIFIHTFFGFKFLNIFGGVLEKIIFFGYEDFGDIFWGHHKLDYIYGLFLCNLVFLRSRYRMGDHCLGC